eukprot:1813708-Rhodomonas_salina.1
MSSTHIRYGAVSPYGCLTRSPVPAYRIVLRIFRHTVYGAVGGDVTGYASTAVSYTHLTLPTICSV